MTTEHGRDGASAPAATTNPEPHPDPAEGERLPSEENCPYCPGDSGDACENVEHWKLATDYWAQLWLSTFEEILSLRQSQGNPGGAEGVAPPSPSVPAIPQGEKA